MRGAEHFEKHFSQLIGKGFVRPHPYPLIRGEGMGEGV